MNNSDIHLDWLKVNVIFNDNDSLISLYEFIEKYARDTTNIALAYKEKTLSVIETYVNNIEIEAWWRAGVDCELLKICALLNSFIYYIPNHNKIELIIRQYKDLLIRCYKQYPHYVYRENVYHVILSGILSKKELLSSGVLTDATFEHIMKYPNLNDELDRLPFLKEDFLVQGLMSKSEYEFLKAQDFEVYENTFSPNGNIDVLPLGVSGSGGKTLLLAALMTLFDSHFIFKDGLYAYYLRNHIQNNRLLPATDTNYIQVINTILEVDNHKHGVSFVEFAGEKVVTIASQEETSQFVSDDVGPYLYELLNNDNKKILVFAVDLTNKHKIELKNDLWIYQSNLFRCLSSLLEKDVVFCKKIIGIHIVVTKRDVIGVNTPKEAYTQMIEKGYMQFYNQLLNICKKYNIMPHTMCVPEIIPFSIGKFYAGETFIFDSTDARKLLSSICHDTKTFYSYRSPLDKIRDFFN